MTQTRSAARRRQTARTLSIIVLCAAGLACGKKGAPLAPIVRIPSAVQGVTASRLGQEIYVSFTVPATNVDRTTPVDVSAVEVYGFTGETPPPRALFVERATRIARVSVALPPPAGAPQAPLPAGAVAPGAKVVVKDTDVSGAEPAKRYYVLVAFSTRNRPGPPSAITEVPLPLLPAPPDGIAATATATEVVLTWASADAPAATGGENAALRVNVYADRPASPQAPTARPVPLNPTPLDRATFSEPVTFGRERCYRLRTVRGDGAMAVEGEPSAPICITPVDTFPPAAPGQLVAVAAAGSISLLWEPNAEPDLAGYLVLRGVPGDAMLRPLTPAPISEARFIDTTVVAGMRYVYVVVAVDRRTPTPNVSAESARVEETAQ